MIITKKFEFSSALLLTICLALISGNPLWAKPGTSPDLNLTPDQVKAFKIKRDGLALMLYLNLNK